MTRRALPILVFIIGIGTTTACTRGSEPIGGKEEPLVGLPQSEVEAHVSALQRVSYIEEVAPRRAGEDAPMDPAALYTANCSACHQANGQGIPAVFPPLANSPYVLSDNVERMASIMLYGLTGPITVLGQQYQSAMAPLGGTLNDQQLAAIATHVRSSWGNSAGAVEPAVFAAMREKWGTRGPFTIQELGEEQ